MDVRKFLPGIQKNILLKNYTTFKIGGRARYFFIAKEKEELVKAVKTAKKFKLPFLILGGGSNLLLSDKGFNGLVIKNEARNFKINKKTIIAESGAILSKIVNASIKAGLSGLVKGRGIPGTVGGAIYGNTGWPKGAWAIGDLVKEIEVLTPSGKIKKQSQKWFAFGYRNSRLKMIHPVKSRKAGAKQFNRVKGEKSVILEIILKFKKGKKIDLEKKSQEILKNRSQKIPMAFSAGSIFKNPAPKQSLVRGRSFCFSAGRQKGRASLSAGELIEKCGLKGKRIGNAKISEKHANFIINLGGGKAKDVKKLINLAKRKVKNKFGIALKEEIQLVGF